MRVKWSTKEWRKEIVKEEVSYRAEVSAHKILVRPAEPAKPALYQFGHSKTATLVKPAVAEKKAVYEDVPYQPARNSKPPVYEMLHKNLEFDVDEKDLLGEKDSEYINVGSPPKQYFVPKNATYYTPE